MSVHHCGIGKTRVLHVCSDTNIGGAGRYVLTLLTQPYLAQRYDLAVACPEGDLATALRHAGVTVLPYPGADRSFSWQALRSLVRLMRSWHPRIVHTHGALAGRVAAAVTGARVIYTKHGLAGESERSVQVRSPGAVLKRASGRLFAHRVVAVSEAVRQALDASGAPPDRIRVIPSGVEAERYSAVPAPVSGVLGTLGRLEPEKGIDVLLAAMQRLTASEPQPADGDRETGASGVRLVIGGDGSQRAALAGQIQALGLTGIARLTGFVADVPAFLSQIGLFVLASRTEGLGMVLLEAMAAGRPVVATRVGGIPEVVVEGETGLLVPPEDPAALAAAIGRLLADPDQAARMGAAGRERVKRLFSTQRMAQQTDALYRELSGP